MQHQIFNKSKCFNAFILTTVILCVLDTTLYDKVCQWLAEGWWFSPDNPFTSTNKTDHHDIIATPQSQYFM